MNTGNVPPMERGEKENFIVTMAILRAEINSLKSLIIDPIQKEKFNLMMDGHKRLFETHQEGLEKDVIMRRSKDFDESKID